MNSSLKVRKLLKSTLIPMAFFLVLSMLLGHSLVAQSLPSKSFLVCGDSKVLIVDYDQSSDSLPHITWTWDAHLAQDLPEDFRTRKFNSTDDCKAINRGKQILVSSSSGAIAVVNVGDKKVVFHTAVANAHSVALLPGNRIVAASSTHAEGNKIVVFDLAMPAKLVFSHSLYSAHGVVWNKKRKRLYALGYEEIREYKLLANGDLSLEEKWSIPGLGGHELNAADADNLFVTEHHGSWLFSLTTHDFKKIEGFPDAENIKSLGRNRAGQYIFTIPEVSWWTYHVTFSNPSRSLAFPDMKVYKARWVME